MAQQFGRQAQSAGRFVDRGVADSTPGRVVRGVGVGLENVASHIPHVTNSNPFGRAVNDFVIDPIKTTDTHVGQLFQGDNPYSGSVKNQIGQAGQDALNIASVIPIGKAAQLAKVGTRQAVKEGAKFGAKAGGGFGAAQGVSTSMQNDLNLPDSLKTIAASTAVGTVAGTGLGVAAPLVGAGIRQAGKVANKPVVAFKNNANSKYVQNQLATSGAARKASDQATSSALKQLKQTENKAKFGAEFDSAVNNPQKLLPAGGGNFTVASVENQRVAQGTEQLAKQYEQDSKKLAETWGQAPNRLNAELERLDQAYQSRHDNLLNGVGEFAVQTRPKVSVKPSTMATLSAKIKNVKNPERKAELVAERQKLVQQELQGISRKSTDTPPSIVQKALATLNESAPYTGAPKSPNAFARAWQTVNGVISQYGTGGKEVARRNAIQRDESEIGQQAFLDKIPGVTSLKKDDFTTFVQTLDKLDKGEPVQVAPHIQQAIAEWNTAIPEIRNRAVAAGLDVGDLGPNYFPRQYKDLFNDKALGKLAEDMVRSGKAETLGDAVGQLQFMRHEYQRPFGNLEKTRQADLPGYEMTPEALTNYIGRSFERITKAEQFGAKNEILSHLQARMLAEGYDAAPGSVADKYIRIALGDVDKSTTGHKVSGKVRAFNALRSLSAAAVSNSSQLLNTATVGGVGRTAKAVVRTATSKQAREDARKAGVVLEHSLANLASQGLGVNGKITRNIASPFFRQVEKFNRQATAIVGKDFGNSLARKASKGNTKAENTLREKLGVKGKIGERLTPEQELQAQRKMVEIAQFKVDPMDLPGWVDSPIGKLVAQFRTFGYKQSDFIYNHVLKEFIKGNPLPLARFVALGVPLGAASLAVKGKIKGTDYTSSDESNTSKSAKALAAVGAFGLPGSEGQNLYKSAQYDNLEGALAGTVGGPTASFGTETAVNLNKAIKGDSSKLQKEGVRSIPAVGPSIANRVFAKSSQPKSVNASNLSSASVADISAQDKKELKDLEAKSKGGEYGIHQLTSGKWAYQVGNEVKTTNKIQDARDAIAKDTFSKTGENYKVIGDSVLRRGADGKVTETPKIKFDYQLGTATLAKQKRAGDLKGYIKTANSQLDSIDKQLQDPSIDPLEAITLQNQAETLLANIDKYSGYGGFKKGGSGGSGKGAQSVYKYNISPNAGGSIAKPKISLKATASNRSVARKQPGNARVSIKKAKV